MSCSLVLLVLLRAASEGNPSCWQEGYSYSDCCDEKYGPEGNVECWDNMHNYKSCCLGESVGEDFEAVLARGHTGDASVLPAIMQLLSSGGEECPDISADCVESSIPLSSWRAFFEVSALSKYMRLQPVPPGAEPWKLWQQCCSGPGSITEHLERLAESCRVGAVALVLAMLPDLDGQMGAAAEGFHMAMRLGEGLEGNCRWLYQIDRSTWPHFGWFLSDVQPDLPCAGPRIFVAESKGESEVLWSRPLSCAERGLCFTEVWIHQFLRRAACRVHREEEADFTYVPMYFSCHDLHLEKSSNKDERSALDKLMSHLVSQPGPPLLIVFSCEIWKMPWRRWLPGAARGYTALAVEPKPLESHPPGVWHCQDCFRPGLDIIIPSATPVREARRLQGFNRDPEHRTLLLTFRGEHAESEVREDVRRGYLDVNETVRPRILKLFQSKRDADVGRPSMRYGFLMGNAHFCLIPRGRGWWTVRLFESFYAGCIPVLLSDDLELPFDFLSWQSFSVKWPMDDLEGLYEHLQLLRADGAKMETLHRNLRKVACWFDYLSPHAQCSPYQGLLRQLLAKREPVERPPLRQFWF